MLYVYSTNFLFSNTGVSKISHRINDFLTQIKELFIKSCECAEEILESYEQNLVANTDKEQDIKDQDKTLISNYKSFISVMQTDLSTKTLTQVLKIDKLVYSFDKITSKDNYSRKIFAEIDVLSTYGREKLDDLNKNIEGLEHIFDNDIQASENTKSKLKSFKETNNKSIKQLIKVRKECKTNVGKIIQEIYVVNDKKKEEIGKTQKKEEVENTDGKKITEKNGLSVTKIIFLILGVLLGVVMISILLYFLLIKRNTTNE